MLSSGKMAQLSSSHSNNCEAVVSAMTLSGLWALAQNHLINYWLPWPYHRCSWLSHTIDLEIFLLIPPLAWRFLLSVKHVIQKKSLKHWPHVWSGLSLTGLTLETWKMGWILMDHGRRRQTAAGLMTLEMGNGPTNRGANFLDSTLRGGSRVDNQTCCSGV